MDKETDQPTLQGEYNGIGIGQRWYFMVYYATRFRVPVECGKKQLDYEQQMSNANGDAIIDIKTDRSGHVWLLSNQYLREYNPRNHSFRTLRNTDSDINVSYFYHLEEVDDNQIGVDGAGAYLQIKSSKMLDQQNAEGSQPYITAIQMGDSTHLLGKSNGEVQIPAQISSVILRCSTFDPIHAQK